MKSFLDRLRRKSAETRKPENVPTTPVPPTVEKAPPVEPPPAAKAAGILPTKPLLPPPLPPPAPAAKSPGEDNSIELHLGDFLERIPSRFLKPGQIDRTLALRFDLNVLASQFTRSDPRIPLVEIYKRQPGIFSAEVFESYGTPIMLPWQRIIDMVVAREGGPSPLPPEILAALTQSLRKQRTAAEQAAAANLSPIAVEPPSPARPPSDAAARSWFSPKPMPAGALTTLPSTLRPPPTAGESLSLSMSEKKAAVPRPNGHAPATPATPATPAAPPQPQEPAEQEIEQAVVMKPAPAPLRPASEVLGEQLAAISDHFERLVRQLEESAEAQASVRAQHVPGLEHLIQAAENKVAEANKERDAVVSLKEHLDSQFEALTFAQSGIATLQETLEAQSREFDRMQQVLENVEEQLATITSERDALAAEKAQLGAEISLLHAAQSTSPDPDQRQRELQDRIAALETQLEEKRPITGTALARRSAARAAAHRIGGQAAGGRALKARLIHWPAYLHTLNGHEAAPMEVSGAPGKTDRRQKRR